LRELRRLVEEGEDDGIGLRLEIVDQAADRAEVRIGAIVEVKGAYGIILHYIHLCKRVYNAMYMPDLVLIAGRWRESLPTEVQYTTL